MKQATTTDGELIRRFCADRDEAAFTALVQRHQGLVFSVCRSVFGPVAGADDAAQATFLVLANKASSLVNQPSVAGWLHRVAWNLATRAVRDARLRQQREQEAADMMAVTADTGREIPRDQLHEALASLPAKHRQALVLRHIEGYSEEQTAHLVGCGLGAMSARLSRARTLLRQKLLHRGLGVASVGAVLAALSAEAQAASVPATFAVTTTQAAAAGGGMLSAGTTAMVQGALHMMWMAKLKLCALTVVAAALVTGGGAMTTMKWVTRHQANVTQQIRQTLQQLYDVEARIALPTRELAWPMPFPGPELMGPATNLTRTIDQIRRTGDRIVVRVVDRTEYAAPAGAKPDRIIEVVVTEEVWEKDADGQWQKRSVNQIETKEEKIAQ